MNIAKKVVSALGGIFLAALLIAALAPKAAHGLVAALVQIVNTPTSAVPAMLATGAGQLYQSNCDATWSSSEFVSCTLGAVPAGYTLFIETVSIHSESDIGDDLRWAFLTTQTSAPYPHSGETPSSPVPPSMDGIGAATVYVPLTKGANFGIHDLAGTVSARVWSSGSPVCGAVLKSPSTDGEMDCTVWGYLASQ